ncbi:hypothetical protein JYT83_00570 [bacterium AH-315-F18]|nr:hypothetical protein [bacterium AH-315-F18]
MLSLKAAKERFVTRFLREMLTRHGGNVSSAARASGVSRQALQHQLRKFSMVGVGRSGS